MPTTIQKPTDTIPPKGRGRPKLLSDRRQRERVVACARQLLLKQGYARTTTDQIAAKCRISKQTLYKLFPEKLSIFAAIVDAHRQDMLALPGDYAGLPVGVALEKIFRVEIDARSHKERIAIIKLMIAEAPLFPELRLIMHKRGAEKSRDELSRWLAEQATAGKIAIDSPDDDAQILMDMVFGPIIRQTVGATRMPQQNMKDHIRRCIGIFLQGVAIEAEKHDGGGPPLKA